MNYLEFKIGDAKRGFRLGLGFIGDILRHYDTDMVGFGDLMVKNPFSATPAILFYAHKQDVIRNGGVVDFKLHDVEDWIESLPNTINNSNIENLLIILMESIKKHLPGVEGSKADAKKKRMQKK